MLIGKRSPCSGGSGFPFSLFECSFSVCPTPYNRKQNELSARLNKIFPSFVVLQFYGAESRASNFNLVPKVSTCFLSSGCRKLTETNEASD